MKRPDQFTSVFSTRHFILLLGGSLRKYGLRACLQYSTQQQFCVSFHSRFHMCAAGSTKAPLLLPVCVRFAHVSHQRWVGGSVIEEEAAGCPMPAFAN